MKNMAKKFIPLAVLLLIQSTADCQENGDRLTIPLSDPSRPSVLKISLASGSITILGYDGKEMIAEASPRNKEPDVLQKNGNGSKRIPQFSTGLKAEEENNIVSISAGPAPNARTVEYSRIVDVVVRVPFNTSLNLRTRNNGSIVVDHVQGDLEASNQNGPVKMSDVSGSTVIDVMNGDILVTFEKVDPQKSMSFSVLIGKIDVTFPPDLNAVFIMKTEGGEFYSDFNVKIQEFIKGEVATKPSREETSSLPLKNGARGVVNGGGAEIHFNNFMGDTYVRKLK